MNKNEFTIPTTFSVEFVGELERINELFSKGRVRIYYKYGNRNGTWITDDFAGKLNESITYVPIVGTFDPETQDFLDHVPGADKKAYGFVPYDANPAWEKGSDGREYYAVDVILWPGYWPEAELIVGKQHSMELNPDSIVGDWKVIGGEYYFVFQQGTFKGLCALGDVFTPCFEDSAFYSLDDRSREFLHQLNASQAEETGGNEKMNGKDKKVVDNDKEIIVEHTENVSNVGEPAVDSSVSDNEEVEQSEEIVETESTNETEAETNTEVETEEVETESTTEEEVETETETEVEPETDSTATEEAQAEEEESINYQELYKTAIAENETLKNEIESLREYKDIYVKQEKLKVLNSFKKRLSAEEVEEFTKSLDDYSTEELKTKLSVIIAEKVLAEVEDDKETSTYVSTGTDVSTDALANIIKRNKK